MDSIWLPQKIDLCIVSLYARLGGGLTFPLFAVAQVEGSRTGSTNLTSLALERSRFETGRALPARTETRCTGPNSV